MEAIPNYTILNLFVISEEVYWKEWPLPMPLPQMLPFALVLMRYIHK
jgi:hypothetical protein